MDIIVCILCLVVGYLFMSNIDLHKRVKFMEFKMEVICKQMDKKGEKKNDT